MLTHLRRSLRATVPEPLRIGVALARRRAADLLCGQARRLARQRRGDNLPHLITCVTQDIRQTALWQGKLANIRLGAARLDGVVLEPGQILSFWALVGRPVESAGFAMGRAIRADVLGGDIGGGLCQLSGLAYELGLRAGLSVVERHAHSRDLYAEHERFTPLGLDATVVWPWKDLRLANLTDAPVHLRFSVADMRLTAAAHGAAPLAPHTIALVRRDAPGERQVEVTRTAPGGAPQMVSRDCYVIDQPSTDAA